MTQLTFSGEIVATNVTLEAFMAGFGEGRYEYIEGVVISMSPNMAHHSDIEFIVNGLLKSYFTRLPLGRAYMPGLRLVLAQYPRRRRVPDGTVILNGSPARFTGATIEGPPDIAIEVVSDESQIRDYEDKFVEYRTAGILEYWIIDPLKEVATFYRLTDGAYVAHFDTGEGYTTPLLPRFVLNTSILWDESFPGDFESLAQIVRVMFDDTSDSAAPAE